MPAMKHSIPATTLAKCLLGVALTTPIHFAQFARAQSDAVPTRAVMSDPAVAQDLLAKLRPLLESADDQAAARIAQFGPGAVAPLFELVRIGRWPSQPGQTRGERLTEAQVAVLLQGLGKLHVPHVQSFLEDSVLGPEGSADDRIVALRILAQVGVSGDLELTIRLASTEFGRLQRASETWFRKAVIGILGRSEDGHANLQSALSKPAPAGIRTLALEALQEVPSSKSLMLLLELVDSERSADPRLLTCLHRLAAKLPVHPEGIRFAALEGLLEHDEPDVRANAALCLAHLDSADSMAALIDLLRDDDVQVQEHAVMALRQLSGRGFGADPERWQTWFEAELAWWDAQGRIRLAELGSAHLGTAVSAVFDLSQHRIFAREFVPELAQLLQAGQPELRRAVCNAFAQVRSRSSVAALIDALEDGEELVREAALQALQQIAREPDLSIDDVALWC